MSGPGHNSDTPAGGQLRAFVERIERLGSGSDVDFARTIEGRMERLDYVLTPLAQIGVISTIAASRAATAGGRLLGVDNDTVRHRVGMVRRRGGLHNAVEDIESWLPNAWPVPPLDGDLIGFVYLMEAIGFPGIVKVGFSRSPKQRLRQLKRLHKIDLRLVCYAPGTEFAEHLIQHEFARLSLANEWFDLTGEWTEKRPLARFYTPERMWNEMREAA